MNDRNKLEGVWLAAWSHIRGALSSSAHERFSWSDDLRFRTGISILANAIDWPDHQDENQINKIFVDAIRSITEGKPPNKNVEFKEFFSKFNYERKKSNEKPLSVYYFLTRLSMNTPKSNQIIKIQNNSVIIGPGAHSSFKNIEFDGNSRLISVKDPSSYCPVCVKAKSKSPIEAAETGQRALYAFTGFINGVTSRYAHNFGSSRALHRIHSSKYQIIADSKKHAITGLWWYSPYEEESLAPYNIDISKINISKDFFKGIGDFIIEDDLISSLHLIHQAGVELNEGLRILLMWNAIEVIFSSYDAHENRNTVIHRAFFLSETPHFRKIKLQLLNTMRNKYAHKAIQSVNSDAIFFDSRNYLIEIIRTIGNRKWSKMTLKEIHSIFDHSIDVNSINISIKKAKIALKLRR